MQWGDCGSQDGQLVAPFGITVTSDGTVLVSDSLTNYRVQAFSPTGKFLFKFGSLGSGNDQFYSPQGLAITDNGTLYVADNSNNRISVWGIEPPLGPFVMGITPDAEVAGSTRNVTILATKFQAGVNFKLSRNEQPDIPVSDLFAKDAFTFGGVLRIPRSAEIGKWDVVLTNPNGSTGKLPEGFEIKEATFPEFLFNFKGSLYFSLVSGVAIDTMTGSMFIANESFAMQRYDLTGNFVSFIIPSDFVWTKPIAVAIDSQRGFIRG
ncbi:MAG: hypothetical protein HY747_03575 [Elusimicrobia bacterium]|nr:hypothetical protein [Elusimicrobiota bacterium]